MNTIFKTLLLISIINISNCAEKTNQSDNNLTIKQNHKNSSLDGGNGGSGFYSPGLDCK